jgi:outer membrane lipoprotein carrier protein
MKKGILFVGCIVIVIGLTSASEALAITGQEVLAEIQKRYEKTNDLQANFAQEYVGRVMRRPQKGEGQVYFKKRGMMRWDYRVPRQILISNGKTLWYYQPDEKQVFVSDISKVVQEKTPLAFLAGEGDLSRDFTLTNFNEGTSPKEEAYVLELTPKEPNAALAKLVLAVDKKTYVVTQSDVIDGLGNVTRTRFLDIQTNVALQDSLFHFDIPPGTEVLRGQDMPGPSTPGAGK